jgi:hypothetical protein
MNLSLNQGSSGNAGAVELGGSAKAAPVNFCNEVAPFGARWIGDGHESLKLADNTADSMAASIVRLEREADELRAEVAMLKQGMLLLAEERDEARVQVRSLNAFAESLVKTVNELKVERVELREKAKL